MSDPMWQKSSFSEPGTENCVELAASDLNLLSLRESEDPGMVLNTTQIRFRWLLDAIRRGELNV